MRHFCQKMRWRQSATFIVLALIAGLLCGLPAVAQDSGPDSAGVDFTDWSTVRVKAYSQALGMEFPAPMADVRVPRLGLQAPLFEGDDDLILDRGLGRIPGTALPGESGNIGIAGHRDGFFRRLKDIQIGDTIEVATGAESAVYLVQRVEIVSPSDVRVLRTSSTPMLTLVTCYPFYFIGHAPQRFIVEAALVQRIAKTPQKPVSGPHLASNREH